MQIGMIGLGRMGANMSRRLAAAGIRCVVHDARAEAVQALSGENIAGALSLRELVFGEYLDVPPGRWLVWHGRGPLGPTRYACEEHRGDLVADVREHYGTIASHPWKMPPYATTARSSDTERPALKEAKAFLEKKS